MNKIIPSVDYNEWMKRLTPNILYKQNNQNLIKVPKLVKPTNKKILL